MPRPVEKIATDFMFAGLAPDCRVGFDVFYFESLDEEIEVHNHPDFAHASLAVLGDFEVFDRNGRREKLYEQKFVEHPKGVDHGIRPLAVPAILMTIVEPGKP
jgi:hypothetical protein